MVGAGIFSLLGAAGEVAGAAVWVSFLIAGIVAMLQGYSFAKFGARFPSAGGLLEYVGRGFGNGHLVGIVGVAAPGGQRHRHRDGGRVVRQLRLLGVHRRQRQLGGAVRRPPHPGDDRAQHRRVRSGGQGADGHRLRGPRDPHALRRQHVGQPGPRPARPVRVPRLRRHRVGRRADLLRLPGVRGRDLHGQGPAGPRPPAPTGDVPRARDRHRDLRRRGPRGVRDPERRGGDQRRAARRWPSRPSRPSAGPGTG